MSKKKTSRGQKKRRTSSGGDASPIHSRSNQKNLALAKTLGLHSSEIDGSPTVDRILSTARSKASDVSSSSPKVAPKAAVSSAAPPRRASLTETTSATKVVPDPSVKPSAPARGLPKARDVSPPPPVDTEALFGEITSAYPALEAHFAALAKAGLKVEVVRADASAGSGAYFNQETNTIRVVDDGTLSHDALKDNVLYESFNAWATGKYKALDKELSLRKASAPKYGEEKARVESQITIKYVDTLLEAFKDQDAAREKLVTLAQAVPEDLAEGGAREAQDELNVAAAELGLTEKALRAIAWAERLAPGYVDNPDPAEHQALETAFILRPHENNVDPTHRFSLASGDLYTYEAIERQTAGGLIGMLQAPLKGDFSDAATRARKDISDMRADLTLLDAMPDTTEEEKNAKANAKVAAYENALQDMIRNHPTFAAKVTPHLLSDGIKSFAGI